VYTILPLVLSEHRVENGVMNGISHNQLYLDSIPLILAVDRGGRPSQWIDWKRASAYYISDHILWTYGEPIVTLRGGTNRDGERSTLAVHPIVAVSGADASRFEDQTIALDNRALFSRDNFTCLYCGERYRRSQLTRDHVFPQGRGGQDVWENVVTACAHCNTRKGCLTPEEAEMPLLALPFAPSHVEGLILSNRRILADQMVFLAAQRPNKRGGAINETPCVDFII